MNRQSKIKIAAAALAVAAVSTGAAVDSAAASASSATHTQRFVSKTVKDYELDHRGHTTDFSRDVRHGTLIGTDASSATYHSKTGVVTGYVTFFRKHGAVHARFRFPTRGKSITIHGTITGGQGSYAGVRGTVIGTVVNDTVTKTVMRYHH